MASLLWCLARLLPAQAWDVASLSVQLLMELVVSYFARGLGKALTLVR